MKTQILCVFMFGCLTNMYSQAAGGNVHRSKNRLVTLSPRYHFEGVDLDQVPAKIRDRELDCYGYYLKCLRHTPLHWVCGFDVRMFKYRFRQFMSECFLELFNCLDRMKNNEGVFGIAPTYIGPLWVANKQSIYYNGEGKRCEFYTRRSHSMEDMTRLYFRRAGDFANQLVRNMPEEWRRASPSYLNDTNTTPVTFENYKHMLQSPHEQGNIMGQGSSTLKGGKGKYIMNKSVVSPTLSSKVQGQGKFEKDTAKSLAESLIPRRPDVFDVALNLFNTNFAGF